MSAAAALPAGYTAERSGRRTLVARSSHVAMLRDAGLDDPRTWQALLDAGARPAGRGRTARLELPDGTRLVLKRMRRGGLAGPLWRGRFAGRRRMLDNLRIPLEAARRGVPTAAPLVLLLLAGPPGLYRAWLGVEEIAGAEDLVRRLARRPPPGTPEWTAVTGCVRAMHDAGVEHRDLNLGNLLVRPAAEGGGWEVFVVDLDRALLHPGPVPIGVRRSALRRLERSYAKIFGADGPLGADGTGLWYELYAGDDRRLERRLAAGRRAGRARLALHRLGWPR